MPLITITKPKQRKRNESGAGSRPLEQDTQAMLYENELYELAPYEPNTRELHPAGTEQRLEHLEAQNVRLQTELSGEQAVTAFLEAEVMGLFPEANWQTILGTLAQLRRLGAETPVSWEEET